MSGYEKSAHLYDLFDQKENVEFFYHYASLAGEVLDIGAGTGRIALPLARRGVKVTCIEPSPSMRTEFQRKLDRHHDLSQYIQLIADKASTFTLGCTFPAAFLSGSFDHFLDDEDRIKSLTNIRRHLDTKGTLVFDVFPGLMVNSTLFPAGIATIGNKEYRRFVGEKVLPDNRKEILLVFEVYEGDRLIERIEERSLVGIISRQGIHRVLTEAGYSLEKEWNNYDFTPYQEKDPLLIVEAIKKS